MPGAHPLDDDTVPPGESLYIRIYVTANAIVGIGPEARPMSGTVRQANRDEPISVDLGSLCTPEETRDRVQGGPYHVATLTAAQARELGLGVKRDAINEGPDMNMAHGLICGSRKDAAGKPTGGLTKTELEKLARVCRMRLITPINK
jgi:hypothetical protein